MHSCKEILRIVEPTPESEIQPSTIQSPESSVEHGSSNVSYSTYNDCYDVGQECLDNHALPNTIGTSEAVLERGVLISEVSFKRGSTVRTCMYVYFYVQINL